MTDYKSAEKEIYKSCFEKVLKIVVDELRIAGVLDQNNRV